MCVIDQDTEPAWTSPADFRLEIKAQFNDPPSNEGIWVLFAGVHLTRFFDPASERLADKFLLSRLWPVPVDLWREAAAWLDVAIDRPR